jgi:radical SAM superfamily enzyme YgiQ (UPF0313 family)
LNLAGLAAIAENAGHAVQLIDGEAERLAVGEIIARVRRFSPDLIGLTATTPSFHIARELAQALRAATPSPIVVGGPHVSYFREAVLYPCFDYLVIGQCEGTFAAFLNAVEHRGDLSSIPGMLYRKDGKSVFSGENREIPPLDTIPFPARHLLKTELYSVGTSRGRKRFTSLMATRGCPFDCVFCSTSIYGTRVRSRSVGNIIREISQVVETFGVDHFYFVDDVLTLNRAAVLSLCDAIEREGLKITWEGATRANLVDEELVSRMARCGFIRISFGFETADEDVRAIIKKGVPLESYLTANRLTSKYRIETINSVMLGLPGDTRESIMRTIRFIRNSRTIKHATFGIAIPYPGSEMYDMALNGRHGLRLETRDFSKYQRYNSAVMSVNGISPAELLRFQKKGLLMIYCVPWRIIPALRRFGFSTLIKPFLLSLWELVAKRRSGPPEGLPRGGRSARWIRSTHWS